MHWNKGFDAAAAQVLFTNQSGSRPEHIHRVYESLKLYLLRTHSHVISHM